jgi:hypothetical protein
MSNDRNAQVVLNENRKYLLKYGYVDLITDFQYCELIDSYQNSRLF